MPEIIDPLERAVTRCVPRGFKGRRWGSENQRRGSIRHQRQHHGWPFAYPAQSQKTVSIQPISQSIMFPTEERYIERIVLKLCIFEDVPTRQGQFQRRMGKKEAGR